MFTTERLRLRGYKPSTDSDVDNLMALMADPQVAPWITYSWLRPVQENMKEALKKGAEINIFFAIVETLEETPDFVGMVAFGPMDAPKNRNVDFSIATMPKHWNIGYGRELTEFMVNHAFEEMGVHRVSLTVLGGNENAIGLYKRCGFVEEGRQRKLVWMMGGWKDYIYMGILEEEWAARKALNGREETVSVTKNGS